MAFVTTRGSVQYDLLPQYTERFTDRGQQELVQLAIVPWDNKDAFITAVMPDVSSGTTTIGQIRASPYTANPVGVDFRRVAMNRLAPQAHPVKTAYKVCDAQLVQGMGWPKQSASNDIEFRTQLGPSETTGKAAVQLTFRTLPYDTTATDDTANATNELCRYVSRRADPSHRNMELPGQRIRLFEPRGNPPVMTPMGGKFLSGAVKTITWRHLSYTWHMVPSIPRVALYYGGRVNQFMFDNDDATAMKGLGHPGTLLFMGAKISDPYSTVSGRRVWDITYNFLHFLDLNVYKSGEAMGHNHLFSPQHNRFGRAWVFQRHADLPAAWQLAEFAAFGFTAPRDFINAEPAGCNIYDYVDLNNLFKLDS